MLNIYTPTFNRIDSLKKLYNSLLNQNNKNFKWWIIDDGSVDDTRINVEKWVTERKIDIEYLYQKNQGKAEAINFILPLVYKTWHCCIDSDDVLLENSSLDILIEDIKNFENENNNYVGLVYPAVYGSVSFKIDKGNRTGLRVNAWKVSNDIDGIKESLRVFRPFVFENIRFPKFESENFVPESVVYIEVAKIGDLLYKPYPLTKGEYRDDGMTKNLVSLIKNNPKGYKLNLESTINFLKTTKQNKSIVNKTKSIIKLQAINMYLKIKINDGLNDKILGKVLVPISFIYYRSILRGNYDE